MSISPGSAWVAAARIVWGNAVARMFDMDGTSPVNHTGVPQVNPAAIPEAKRQEIAAYFAKIFPDGGQTA